MLRKTIQNFASQLFVLLISIGDRFILAALLLRVWQTEMFADWTTILSIASLLGLADLGFVVFVGNKLQKSFSIGDEKGFRRIVGTSIFSYGILALGIASATTVLSIIQVSTPFLSVIALTNVDAAWTLFFAGISQSLHTFKSACSTIFRGRGDFALGAVVDGVSTLCILGCALAAAALGADVQHLAAVYLGAHLIFGWGILLTKLRRRYPDISLKPLLPSRRELQEAGLAMRWYALSCSLPTIWLQTPVLLLNGLGMSGAPVVSFVIQRTLVNFGRSVSVMLSVAGGVELVAHVHANDKAMIERGVRTIGRLVAAIAGVMIAGLLSFGDQMIMVWTGKPALFDAPVVFWLAMPALLVAPATPLLYLAHLADLPKPQAYAQLVQTFVAAVCLLALAGRYGLGGVAFGLALGELLGIGLLLPILLNRHLQISYWKNAALCIPLGLTAFAWAEILAYGISLFVRTNTILGLILTLVTWAGAALAPVIFFLTPARRLISAKLRAIS